MRTLSIINLSLVSILGSALSYNVSANGASFSSDGLAPGDSDSKWVAGAMALSLNNIYKDGDNLNMLIPVLEYRGEVVFLKDGELGAKLLSSGKTDQGVFSGGLLLRGQASYLDDNDNYEDDSALVGLEEREAVAEAGIYFRHKSKIGQAKIKFFEDLHSEKYGNRAVAQYTFDINLNQWQINPTVTVTWEDSDRVNHFYGVSQGEATQSRAQYTGKSAVNLAAGINSRYRVNKNWDIDMTAAYVYLGDGITDSSIVGEDDIALVAIGTKYNF